MKKRTKVLLLLLSAALLVVASVMGTMAYLTSKDEVTNTFTVGKVEIDLKETPVDLYGDKTGSEKTTDSNAYKLIPGKTYTKDPTVTVKANSEDCWLFIEVENGITEFEADNEGNDTIAEQITNVNEWSSLAGYTGVYYKEVTNSSTDQKFDVFSAFTIDEYANILTNKTAWDAITETNPELVKVSAYAIQKAELDSATEAWGALKAQLEAVSEAESAENN